MRELIRIQIAVMAALSDQRVMIAILDNLAILDHQNAAGGFDG